MFRCQRCHKNSEYGEKQNRIVIEKKDKSYHYYIVKIRIQKGKTKQIYTETKPDVTETNKQIVKEFTTRGWEIKKETKICGECANVKV